MARTKGRFLENEKIQSHVVNTFRAGIYTRLSEERKEKNRDKSTSLETQEIMGRKICLEKGISVVKIYKDYEYTGTNFKRPGFDEMIVDLKQKLINCIIVKDLSRFGREYIQIGNYIENVFPFLGIRFISIGDHFDTFEEDNYKKNFEIAIKNIMNDVYSKDLSEKVKASKRAKMKKGLFIGAKAPYGYAVENTEKGRILTIDTKASKVVKEIFTLAYQGKSIKEIGRILTPKYSTPLEYRRTGCLYKQSVDTKQWNPGSISRIIKNETYVGNLVQNAHNSKIFPETNGKFKPESEWIRVEDAHENIISKEIFYAIQDANQKKKINPPSNDIYRQQNKENRYKQVLVCGICGESLSRRHDIMNLKYGRKPIAYHFCVGGNYLNLTEDHVRIREQILDETLNKVVSEMILKCIEIDDLNEKIEEVYLEKEKDIKNQCSLITKKLDCKRIKIQKKYEAYIKGEILKSQFINEKEALNRMIQAYKHELEEKTMSLIRINNKKGELQHFFSTLLNSKDGGLLEKELIESLVNRIEIYPNKEIKIVFKFDLDKEITSIFEGDVNA